MRFGIDFSMILDGFGNRFGIHFGLKIFLKNQSKNQADFGLILERFLLPHGIKFGSILVPKIDENGCPKTGPNLIASWKRFSSIFDGFWNPRPTQKSPKNRRIFTCLCIGSETASGELFGRSWDSLGRIFDDFWTILDLILDGVWAIWEGFWMSTRL